MQVDPIKSMLKAPGTNILKLKYHINPCRKHLELIYTSRN